MNSKGFEIYKLEIVTLDTYIGVAVEYPKNLNDS